MRVVVGISCKDAVMADLDDVGFDRVKGLACLTCNHFRLGGFVVLRSSKGHYHVVFDKPIKSWNRVLKVLGWIGIVSNNKNVWKWVCMQAIKGACTLRVSKKTCGDTDKPVPHVVYRFGSQDSRVSAFLEFRKSVLAMLKRLEG